MTNMFLKIQSYCCLPKSIFSIGDIDEDGIHEIAQYYSSCSGRYKQINLWTMKEGNWKEISQISFTLYNLLKSSKTSINYIKSWRKELLNFWKFQM